jgi:acyl-CoA thioesterase-1
MTSRLLFLTSLLIAAACGEPAPLVIFLGDSLTSGWKLERDEAYPALVGRTLRERGRPVRVLNAGVSGDTIAQGRERLPRLLAHRPDVLVVALGINDGLKGLPLDEAEAGLRRIVEEAQAAGAHTLLVGVRLPPPPRHGPDHASRFGEMHPRIASDFRLALVPDLLDGVSGEEALLFPQSFHPNAAGQQRLARNVLPHLELVLAAREAHRRAAGRGR